MSAPDKVRPKVDLDATAKRLVRLELGHGAEHLADCLAQSAKAELPAHAFLDPLLDIELNGREERRVKTSLRLSGLPTGQTLASFDFAFQPSVERSRVETREQLSARDVDARRIRVLPDRRGRGGEQTLIRGRNTTHNFAGHAAFTRYV